MQYYSTNKKAPKVSLQEAVVKGLAPDRGLYMPEKINHLPKSFFDEIENATLHGISKTVADAFFGEDIAKEKLDFIVAGALNFEIPLKKVEEDIRVLELFHGPTFAFKDVGARFMARMLSHFVQERKEKVNVLVATSGDTGSAVANGFLDVEGVTVFVLYPSGKVSDIQEAQFATLGKNIVALEVDGTFDDCQALVKSAFMDEELNAKLNLTSANSINVARFLPQSFYYFWAYAQLIRETGNEKRAPQKIVISVPSGNLGNLTAGLFAKRMGLPIHRFIAANNRNDVFREYLQTGKYLPRTSVQTIANAMDVGAPGNFDRILDLYGGELRGIYNESRKLNLDSGNLHKTSHKQQNDSSKQQEDSKNLQEALHKAITSDISSFRYTDEEIRAAIKNVYLQSGYLLDPHGACAYLALKEGKKPGETGIFLATAHPAKFKETVEACTGIKVQMPEALASFMQNKKQSIPLPNDFNQFKKKLISLS